MDRCLRWIFDPVLAGAAACPGRGAVGARSLAVSIAVGAGALWAMSGCGGNSGRDVACITRTDCPLGQVCVAGDCVVDLGPPPGRDSGSPFDAGLPSDSGPSLDAGPGPVTTDGGPGGCTSSLTCTDLNAACGLVHDGCSFLDCGDCKDPSVCGGGGVPNQCGVGACVPTITCASLGAECGQVLDECMNVHDCGLCSRGQICGAGGTPFKCGGSGPVCTPSTSECQMQGVECGPITNACGGVTQCGACDPTEFCSSRGQCDGAISVCIPMTCDQVGAECGFIDNGCDGMVDCSRGVTCPPNHICIFNRCQESVPRF